MKEIIQAKIKMRFRGTTLKTWNNPDKQQLLLILDQLRKRIEDGELIDHFEIIREISLADLSGKEEACICSMKSTDLLLSPRKRKKRKDRLPISRYL